MADPLQDLVASIQGGASQQAKPASDPLSELLAKITTPSSLPTSVTRLPTAGALSSIPTGVLTPPGTEGSYPSRERIAELNIPQPEPAALTGKWERALALSGSGEAGDAELFNRIQKEQEKNTAKYIEANQRPDVELDPNSALPTDAAFLIANESKPENKAKVLAAQGYQTRILSDGNIAVTVPDEKNPGKTKEVLVDNLAWSANQIPSVLPTIGKAAGIASAAEAAAAKSILARLTGIGATAFGVSTIPTAITRAATETPIDAPELLSEGGKEAAINVAIPALAEGTSLTARGARNILAGGGITPIEQRGVPALARLTGKEVPAEIATGRPILARASNAPLTGTFEQTSKQIESALGEQLGEKIPAIDYRKKIGEAFNERAAPIMELADSWKVRPALENSRNVLKQLESQYGTIVKEGASETGEQATEATARNSVINKLRDIQSRLEKTNDLSVSKLLENRRLIDDDIDFQNLTGKMDDLLQNYRNALNADAEVALRSIPKQAQTAYASTSGNGLTPAESFLANNADYSEALKPIELQKVINSVRATPPKGVAPEDFNRVDYTALNKKIGRSGGKIVDADARAKIEKQIGEENVKFLEDIADASQLLEKYYANIREPDVTFKSLGKSVGLGTVLGSAGGHFLGSPIAGAQTGALVGGLLEAAPKIGESAIGAALRSQAVNRFLATGALPNFSGLTRAATLAVPGTRAALDIVGNNSPLADNPELGYAQKAALERRNQPATNPTSSPFGVLSRPNR